MLRRTINAAEVPAEVRPGWASFFRNEQGIAITEYGLLVTFIAIIVIGVIVIFGGGIQSWFGSRTGAITTY